MRKQRLVRAGIGVLTIGLLLAAWAFVIEPSRLVATQETLALPGWPATLSGFKVALVSDLHIGAPFVDADAIAAVLARIDAWTRKTDATRALSFVTDDAPVLAFTHNPDVFPTRPRRFVIVLAGHTHGGQVKLPLVGRPIVPSEYGQRYAAGLKVEEGRRLFVTTGVGTSVLPVRFGVPPEVALLTLIPAE